MKKILFISPFNISNDMINSDGVMKKICLEIKTFEMLGNSVDYIFWDDNNDIKLKSNEIMDLFPSTGYIYKDMLKIYSWMRNNLMNKSYDILYIRHIGSSIAMAKFLRCYKKLNPNISVLAEIPTVMGRWEPGTSFLGKLKFFINKLLNYILSFPIDRFITFSNDLRIYGRPTLCVENFVDVHSLPVRKPLLTDKFILLGIAMMTPSHGFDRVIRGLYEYYLNHNNNKIVIFKIIGEGSSKERLQELTRELKLEDYVKFEGKKSTDEITRYIDEANIAVASLAIFRKKCAKASELKIREYCARGIPFIYSAEEPILQDVTACLKQPHDESPINIQRVIEFSNSIDVTEASIELRKIAESRCTCESQLKDVLI